MPLGKIHLFFIETNTKITVNNASLSTTGFQKKMERQGSGNMDE